MREIRLYGSEGGGAHTLPTPIFICTHFSAIPAGTLFILVQCVPRTDVLGLEFLHLPGRLFAEVN
jgi:hypothetical protein